MTIVFVPAVTAEAVDIAIPDDDVDVDVDDDEQIIGTNDS